MVEEAANELKSLDKSVFAKPTNVSSFFKNMISTVIEDKKLELATLLDKEDFKSNGESEIEKSNQNLLKNIFYSKWHFINYKFSENNVNPEEFTKKQNEIYFKDISKHISYIYLTCSEENEEGVFGDLFDSLNFQLENKNDSNQKIMFLISTIKSTLKSFLKIIFIFRSIHIKYYLIKQLYVKKILYYNLLKTFYTAKYYGKKR